MAKKTEPPKPIYPIVHEFEDSLKEALQQAGMLLTMTDTILKNPDSMKIEKIRQMLKERADALRKAMYGDEQT